MTFGRLARLVLVVAPSLVTGCHSSSGSSSSGTSAKAQAGPAASASSTGEAKDACSLLTPAEISTALALSVGPGQPANDGRHCTWDSPQGVEVSSEIENSDEAFRESRQGAGKQAWIKAVDGVGDEAYAVMGGPASMLDFRVGDRIYEVGLLTAGPKYPQDKAIAIEKQLALDAVPRVRGR